MRSSQRTPPEPCAPHPRLHADNCANLELQAQRSGGSAEDEAAAEACRRQYMSTTLDKGQLAEAGKAKSPSLAPNVVGGQWAGGKGAA